MLYSLRVCILGIIAMIWACPLFSQCANRISLSCSYCFEGGPTFGCGACPSSTSSVPGDMMSPTYPICGYGGQCQNESCVGPGCTYPQKMTSRTYCNATMMWTEYENFLCCNPGESFARQLAKFDMLASLVQNSPLSGLYRLPSLAAPMSRCDEVSIRNLFMLYKS